MVSISGIALITGGTSGIGFAAAHRFAARGYDLLLTYREDRERAESAASGLRKLGVKAATVSGDLAEDGAVDRIFAAKDEHFGERSVELLLHCAGRYLPGARAHRFAGGVDTDAYEYYQAIYPKAFVALAERAIPDMPDRSGRLVALSSPGSNINQRPRLGYDLAGQAKASLEVISRYYALHLAERGITCNIVVPGTTDTPGWEAVGMTREMLEKFAADRSPMKAVMDPGDVANAIDFLMSERARFVTGTTLYVDGGTHMS